MFTYRKDEKAMYKKLKIELVYVISIYLVDSFCLLTNILGAYGSMVYYCMFSAYLWIFLLIFIGVNKKF